MPPEQMDAKEADARGRRVRVVAVLLMELWSGKAPFARRTREDIEAAMRAPHPRPSDIDPRLLPLDEVMASAMALDPAARPQQADDLGRALRRFLAGIDLGDLARHLGDRVRDLRPPRTAAHRAAAHLAAAAFPPHRHADRNQEHSRRVTRSRFVRRSDGRRPARDLHAADRIGDRRRRRHADSEKSRPLRVAPPVLRGRHGGDDATRNAGPGASRDQMQPRGPRARADRAGVIVLGTLGAGALATAAFFLGRSGTAGTPALVNMPRASVVASASASGPAPAPAFCARACVRVRVGSALRVRVRATGRTIRPW